MRITKVTYKWDEKVLKDKKALIILDITLENKIKLADVRLYKNEKGYFLVFPSRQDIYQTIQSMNPDVKLNLPSPESGSDEKKRFEEFFFPIDSDFYRNLLALVIEGMQSIGYSCIKSKGCISYFPLGGCNSVKGEAGNS